MLYFWKYQCRRSPLLEHGSLVVHLVPFSGSLL